MGDEFPLPFAPGFSTTKKQKVPATPAAPTKSASEVEEARRRTVQEERRRSGRSSTQLTGVLGVQNKAPTAQKVLLSGTA